MPTTTARYTPIPRNYSNNQTATMSPTAFRSQVNILLDSLEDCLVFCIAIRQNRRLGSTTAALDQLEHTLETSKAQITKTFRSLQKSIGSRADLGDEDARQEMAHCIRDLDTTVKSRLSELTYKPREGRDPVVPGFRRLDERWVKIYADVVYTLDALSYRLTTSHKATKTSESTYTTTSKPSQHRDVVDDFRKNCWVEKEARGGGVMYVNVYNEDIRQRDVPLTGFVQYLPKKTRLEPVLKEVRFREQDSYARTPIYQTAGW